MLNCTASANPAASLLERSGNPALAGLQGIFKNIKRIETNALYLLLLRRFKFQFIVSGHILHGMSIPNFHKKRAHKLYYS